MKNMKTKKIASVAGAVLISALFIVSGCTTAHQASYDGSGEARRVSGGEVSPLGPDYKTTVAHQGRYGWFHSGNVTSYTIHRDGGVPGHLSVVDGETVDAGGQKSPEQKRVVYHGYTIHQSDGAIPTLLKSAGSAVGVGVVSGLVDDDGDVTANSSSRSSSEQSQNQNQDQGVTLE